ncbi:TPA: hypothetical protein ACSY4N_14250 [Listeria monocytogenes]|nr:hypothetical protein [Listeria monocytogenes]EHW1518796.1 hypothetical protein [Listeria monocytogenes]
MNWKKKRNHSKSNSIIQELKYYNRIRLFLFLIGSVSFVGWIIWVLKTFYSIYKVCVVGYISSVSEFGLFGSAESTQKQLMYLCFIVIIIITMITLPCLYIETFENSILTIIIGLMIPLSIISFIFTLFNNDFFTLIIIFAIFIPYMVVLRIYFEQSNKIEELAHKNIYSNKTIIAFNLEEVLHAGDAIFAVHDEWRSYLKEISNVSKIVKNYTESPPGEFKYFCWEKTFKYKIIGLTNTKSNHILMLDSKKEIIILPRKKYYDLISELKLKYPEFEYNSDKPHIIAIDLDKSFLTPMEV